jgi:DNA polymerase-3 subunit epsilon
MGHSIAVIDTETTGFSPKHHRIVEIAAVVIGPDGSIQHEWSTLLNPGRDLGPTHVHHIEARDVREAPEFADIAGDLAALLRGRVIAAHHARFDAGFVEAEYRRAGHPAAVPHEACLCTMKLAAQVMPGAGRSLAACCRQAGIVNDAAHSALADARAAAKLIQTLAAGLGGLDGIVRRSRLGEGREAVYLPPLAATGTPRVNRGAANSRSTSYLDRLAARLPPAAGPEEHNEYLALLDRALIDRVLSAREADQLVSLAADMGIDRPTATRLNGDYLGALTRAAVADGQVTDGEFQDLTAVAELLGLGAAAVAPELDRAWQDRPDQLAATGAGAPQAQEPGFRLSPGDLIVFTGELSRPRAELEAVARSAGLVPHPAVTKKVAVLVAADPDSLSGKARKAAGYGIPIITEASFLRLKPEVQ